MLNRFLKTDIGEIRIFSRNEKMQDDMRREFQVKMPEVADKIKFYIGDALASLITQRCKSIVLPFFIKDLRPNAKLMLDAILLKNVFY